MIMYYQGRKIVHIMCVSCFVFFLLHNCANVVNPGTPTQICVVFHQTVRSMIRNFVVGMGKNLLTQWSTERMFTFSSRVLLLQSRQQSCLLRNENIIIFISYQIFKFYIAVKNTYKLQISYFQVIQVKISDYQFWVEFVQLV